jgi:membrane-associated phospholipid phosphatase
MPATKGLLQSKTLQISLLLSAATVLLVWIAAISGLDRALLETLAWPEKHPRSDLLMLLRVWGSLWTWLLIALAIGLQKRQTPPRCTPIPRVTGLRLLVTPLLAGALAELLKLLVRRQRPSDLESYLFRSWSEQPWSTKGLGMPSSHTAVAFAGSMTLALLYPRLAIPSLVLAIGCGYTRVASGAHFPSDVLAGAAVGVVTALVLGSTNWLAARSAGQSSGR